MTAKRISIIVPTLRESATISRTLERLREPEVLEVIVVDGGSRDGTAEAAARLSDRVIETVAGRARQMNAGAAAAKGEILFFLHADTVVPAGFARSIVAACGDPYVVGGRFDLRLDAAGLPFRALEGAINLRARLSKLGTGDQGLFVRRGVFERLHGFPEVPLLEDLALSIALKRHGRIACLGDRLTTSARRWQQDGIVRTVALMWLIRGLYFAGVSPERLARLYRDAR